MFRTKPINCVEVKVVTWQKDSHGLFDYQGRKFSQMHYHIDNSCVLFQKDNELVWTNENNLKHLTEEYTLLGKVQVNPIGDAFCFERFMLPEGVGSGNKLQPYLVVRSLKNQKNQQKGYPLKLGDSIKFGRLEYLVLEYRDDKSVQSVGGISATFETHFADRVCEGTCKICLCQEQDQNNFLIAPCNCKGSCMFVHLECLKRWIQNKIYKESHGVVEEYNFAKFQCEICKVPYPQKVVSRMREYDMLTIDRPDEPYIILQSLCSDKKAYKNLFLITFKKGNPLIKLGRGHQCQMRLTDISVSRVHAQITHKNGKFIIYDNSSKFGTLIKIKNSQQLSQEKCAIQVGRTVLICSVKPSQSIKGRKESEQCIQQFQQTRV